tara:strand:+ start:122 stop:466 length:345 start_codon:yes stop_codon:yes gene_type:complete
MTTEVKEEEKSKTSWTKEEKELIHTYGCQLIAENATAEQIEDRQLPTDTMIVSYMIEDKLQKDLCRGSTVKIFDLYYDKFGKDSIQKIDYGNGTVNPSQWGYKAPPPKKKRRKP